MNWKRTVLLAITLMLSGRAMTIAFVADAGDTAPGSPPSAWTMPLLGDAVIGIGALAIAYLIVRRRGLAAWATIIVWNSLGIWDALSAYVVHRSDPWPEFFMIETFGAAMFFAASAMHLVAIRLVSSEELRTHFLSDQPVRT
jgi:hypothetical protein